MKVQLESIEEFESIFSEILGEETSKYSQNELNVLLNIKNLFLKNVEIQGEQMNIGEITQERLERKKEHAKLILEVEEAEKSKTNSLKSLCELRRELPHTLKEEIEHNYKEIMKKLSERTPSQSVDYTPENEEEIDRIKHTVYEITEKLPSIITQIKEKMSYVEKEVKERIEQQGREIETETLSLLFKDDLEIK
ncbi:hypothetical protein NEIRO03_0505 [Nematocida sp. AWRm78]|nr:hypothetical protein NEIRO02_0436 [Nematocida sp. AWRm79]KAI5182863.1 hypothetical protein NEIRO03_0505 [Nematocida sp. AWRm78]